MPTWIQDPRNPGSCIQSLGSQDLKSVFSKVLAIRKGFLQSWILDLGSRNLGPSGRKTVCKRLQMRSSIYCVYIYIYRKKERERESRDYLAKNITKLSAHTHVYFCIYICGMYIFK